jgi:hypothetical protein
MAKINPGQGVLPEMPPVQQEPLVVGERAAVGRLLGPRALRLFGVNPESFADIAETDLSKVRVDSLRASLYSERGMQIGGIAVNEDEYQIIPRSSRAIKTTVEAQTDRARKIDTNRGRSEAAKHRSVGHALEAKDERTAGLFTWLEDEHSRLLRLKKELDGYPGHAHMNQGELLELAQSVVEFSFKNLLNVVAKQRELSPEETVRLEAAFGYMLTSTPQKTRAAYLKDMVGLSLNYNRQRTTIFKNRTKIARSEAVYANKKAAKITK